VSPEHGRPVETPVGDAAPAPMSPAQPTSSVPIAALPKDAGPTAPPLEVVPRWEWLGNPLAPKSRGAKSAEAPHAAPLLAAAEPALAAGGGLDAGGVAELRVPDPRRRAEPGVPVRRVAGVAAQGAAARIFAAPARRARLRRDLRAGDEHDDRPGVPVLRGRQQRVPARAGPARAAVPDLRAHDRRLFHVSAPAVEVQAARAGADRDAALVLGVRLLGRQDPRLRGHQVRGGATLRRGHDAPRGAAPRADLGPPRQRVGAQARGAARHHGRLGGAVDRLDARVGAGARDLSPLLDAGRAEPGAGAPADLRRAVGRRAVRAAGRVRRAGDLGRARRGGDGARVDAAALHRQAQGVRERGAALRAGRVQARQAHAGVRAQGLRGPRAGRPEPAWSCRCTGTCRAGRGC
jgi:hypothetical protein